MEKNWRADLSYLFIHRSYYQFIYPIYLSSNSYLFVLVAKAPYIQAIERPGKILKQILILI